MTYKAAALHDPPWWSIEITEGLPANMLGVSQARRLTEVEPTAREVIAELTEVDPSRVEVEVTIRMPEPVAAAQEALAEAETKAQESIRAAAECRRRVAMAARNEGFTMREVAKLLGISHQRVSQLISAAKLSA